VFFFILFIFFSVIQVQKGWANFISQSILVTLKRIFEITGITGQGKSQLMYWGYHKTQNMHKKGAFCDFEIIQNDYNYLLKTIAEQNAECFSTFLSKFSHSENHENLSNSFRNDLDNQMSRSGFKIFFDSSEKTNKQIINDFEKYILNQYIAQPNFMIAVAGQKPLQLSRRRAV